MKGVRAYAAMMLLAFAAAFLGVVVGQKFIAPKPSVENHLHRVIHEELALDAQQTVRIEAIEKGFMQRRQGLLAEMRQDNKRLAQAIAAEHGYGPRVNAAIDHSHHVMGQLQKETLQHLFAMRDEMRPDQARKFDAAIADALTAPDQ